MGGGAVPRVQPAASALHDAGGRVAHAAIVCARLPPVWLRGETSGAHLDVGAHAVFGAAAPLSPPCPMVPARGRPHAHHLWRWCGGGGRAAVGPARVSCCFSTSDLLGRGDGARGRHRCRVALSTGIGGGSRGGTGSCRGATIRH